MENQLTQLERKIDDLLASVDGADAKIADRPAESTNISARKN